MEACQTCFCSCDLPDGLHLPVIFALGACQIKKAGDVRSSSALMFCPLRYLPLFHLKDPATEFRRILNRDRSLLQNDAFRKNGSAGPHGPNPF